MKKNFTILAFALLAIPAFAQVPFEHISTSDFNAERVAKFGVIDVDTDFLEITNSTQFDGSFIPSIWAHQQTDDRYVLRLFATTTSDWDNGEIPLMIFRTEFRSALNGVAPVGGSFPWGTVAGNIVNRPLFGWENGNTQLMTLRANGFLGLGTTAPTALFHTVGTVRHQGLPNATDAVFMLGTDDLGNVAQYPVPDGGTGTEDADWLQPNNTVSYDIDDAIYTNGNVGINVQNPQASLHVAGTAKLVNLPNAFDAAFMLGTDAEGNVAEYPVPTGETGGTPDADWLKPDDTPSYDIDDAIYTNGNVGINVQNPETSLHVDGTVRLENLPEDTDAAFMLGTDAEGNVAEYPVPTGGTGGTPDADWLKPDNTVSYSINENIYTNGKVGIGTSEFPGNVGSEDVSFYSLYVTGGILTEEVRVALQEEWADYVFKEDYDLPTLEEVEQHIKENGHLKDIPSAEEVKENGVELGEMNKKLLQKIEELTLYMIEMNKKIEEQQREIDALKQQKK